MSVTSVATPAAAIALVAVVSLSVLTERTSASVEGNVPVSGMLTTSDTAPALGETVEVTLEASALEPLPGMRLHLDLDTGLEPLGDQTLERTFNNLSAGEKCTLSVRVRVTASGEQAVRGIATAVNTPALVLQRSFVVVLNAAPKPAPNAKIIQGADGRPVIVFPSGNDAD